MGCIIAVSRYFGTLRYLILEIGVNGFEREFDEIERVTILLTQLKPYNVDNLVLRYMALEIGENGFKTWISWDRTRNAFHNHFKIRALRPWDLDWNDIVSSG